MFDVPDRIVILVVDDIVGRIAVAETIRKDLIHHGTLGPGRGLKAGYQFEFKMLI